MPRVVFELEPTTGFQTSNVESLGVTEGADRLFVGTGDGGLLLYRSMRDTTDAIRARGIELRPVEVLKKAGGGGGLRGGGGGDKKAVAQLRVVDSWNCVLGVIDNCVHAYDLSTYRPTTSIMETRGCTLFAVHEATLRLCAVVKRKAMTFQWQGIYFAPIQEISLGETPRAVLLTAEYMVLGNRRDYAMISFRQQTAGAGDALPGGAATANGGGDNSDDENGDAASAATASTVGVGGAGAMANTTPVKIMDLEREYRTLVCLESPATPTRAAGLLLSNGAVGHLLNPQRRSQEERLEWSTVPVTAEILLPFLVTVLPSRVEIHDFGNLTKVQTIDLAGLGSSPKLCATPALAADVLFVASANRVAALHMIPLSSQVTDLVERGLYEEAISICELCPDKRLVSEIDVPRIHERYAFVLYQRGDYDGAMQHFLAAETHPAQVAVLFPDLVPHNLPMPAAANDLPPVVDVVSASTSSILNRAANALVEFMSHHRHKTRHAADRVECQLAGDQEETKQSGFIADADEVIKVAVMVDTVLITSLLHCIPPRREEVIKILSSSNRCHNESCAVLLAAKGNSFTEALLWLYRSKGEHRRVLAALTEDRCVGPGAWTREQYYRWMTDYLSWMWLQQDQSLARMVLSNSKQVLETNPALGLSIFVTALPTPVRAIGSGVTAGDAAGGAGSVGGDGAGADGVAAMGGASSGTAADRTATGGAFDSAGAAAASSTGAGPGGADGPNTSGSGSAAGGAGAPAAGNTINVGGYGITPQEVVNFLKSASPMPNLATDSRPVPCARPFDMICRHRSGGARKKAAAASTAASDGGVASGTGAAAGTTSGAGGSAGSRSSSVTGGLEHAPEYYQLPLQSGRALTITYLEWLVYMGAAPASMHNDFAQLLMEGLPAEATPGMELATNNLLVTDRDSNDDATHKAYRHKLQRFLLSSMDYQPELLLKYIPLQYLHEYALLLSRLGRHEDVLRIYVHQLGDMSLAEQYCDRIWRGARAALLTAAAMANRAQFGAAGGAGGAGGKDDTSGAGGGSGGPGGPGSSSASSSASSSSSSSATSAAATAAAIAAAAATAAAAAAGVGSGVINASSAGGAGMVTAYDENVYLCLMRVLMTPEKSFDDDMAALHQLDVTALSSSNSALTSADNARAIPVADRVNAVTALAEKYSDRVDPCGVLDLLPASTPLTVLSTFLAQVMRHRNTRTRGLKVQKELLRVNEVKSRTELIQYRSQAIEIHEGTTCLVCGRAIANSAVLWYPNGTVVHYSCGAKDLHTCPVTKQQFDVHHSVSATSGGAMESKTL